MMIMKLCVNDISKILYIKSDIIILAKLFEPFYSTDVVGPSNRQSTDSVDT